MFRRARLYILCARRQISTESVIVRRVSSRVSDIPTDLHKTAVPKCRRAKICISELVLSLVITSAIYEKFAFHSSLQSNASSQKNIYSSETPKIYKEKLLDSST